MAGYSYDPNLAAYGAPAAPPAADPYAQPYAPPAPGYGAPPPAPYGGYGNPDEVRTVFITGFPADVKERELNNMLRFLQGYEASQMHFKNGQAQGFALFANGALARQAVDVIHNMVFDETAVLRCEMAHKNMYLKDDQTTKRGRYDYGGYGAPPPAYGYSAPPPVASPVMPVGPRGYAPVTNTKDNPPCNTLFIGNLGDTTSEAELRGIFGSQPGFRQLKLVRGPKSVTCFVEFGDVASAMHVHQSQQGAILTSSDRGGIRIQYSKNPFGRKRDFGGNLVDTSSYAPPAGADPGSAPAGDASGYQPSSEAAYAPPAETGFTEAANNGEPAS